MKWVINWITSDSIQAYLNSLNIYWQKANVNGQLEKVVRQNEYHSKKRDFLKVMQGRLIKHQFRQNQLQ